MANMRSITAAKTRKEAENETKQGALSSDRVTKDVFLPQSTASLVHPGLSSNLALLAQVQQLQGPYLRPAAVPTAVGQNASLVNALINASLSPTTNQSSIPQQRNLPPVANPQPQANALSLYLLALSQLQGSVHTPPNQQQLQLSSLLSTLQPIQQAILLGQGTNFQQQQQLQQQQRQPSLQQSQQHGQVQPASEEERQRLAQIAEAILRFKPNPPPA